MLEDGGLRKRCFWATDGVIRDGNGGKSKNLKVGVQGPQKAPGGIQGQPVGVRGQSALKLKAFF